MKTLKTIQTLAKIGKILSKIVFICALIGGILCAVGLCTAWFPQVVKAGNVTIHGIVYEPASISLGQIYAGLTAATVFCIAETILAKTAENYFKFQLEKGTPFDFEVSKKLFSLGIKTIWMPLAATVIAAIAYAIFDHFMKGVSSYEFEGFSQVWLGFGFIIFSHLCKAGAEMAGAKEEIPETQE